jgi:magnesium-protoporphyrin O-methyltransferase
MRQTLLSRFPDDLRGWRILDAGCGAGQIAVELARRGADVVAVDLSPKMIEHAGRNNAAIATAGKLQFIAGDMLSASHGQFDGVVAMDSIIHYAPKDAADAVAGLAQRTSTRIAFTIAPWTLPLAVMHAAGKLIPGSDRAPSIVPVSPRSLALDLMFRPGMEKWHASRIGRINSGFYVCEALEVSR